ncbi:LmeA family phospholipid-binding protein [Streptomyces sp. NPDC047061]|uniref:LmeA family phospholipid-binding protein n=1 Tax=Streptomyces sp. NPDC047061 TaxID=3154605 RepID=UPI00340E3CB1
MRTSGCDDERKAEVGRAEANAFLSCTDVSNAFGLKVSQSPRTGQIIVSALTPLDGEATVTATVSAVTGNRVGFQGVQVTGGPRPAVGQAALDLIFKESIQLENIPHGLYLRSVAVTTEGLSTRFSGQSVTFRPGCASWHDMAADGGPPPRRIGRGASRRRCRGTPEFSSGPGGVPGGPYANLGPVTRGESHG